VAIGAGQMAGFMGVRMAAGAIAPA
jgi:hypothetical protein